MFWYWRTQSEMMYWLRVVAPSIMMSRGTSLTEVLSSSLSSRLTVQV